MPYQPYDATGFSKRLRRNAPAQIQDLSWLDSYMADLRKVLSGGIPSEALTRQEATIGRGQTQSEDSLRASAGSLGGTSSPAYQAILSSARGGFNRERATAGRNYELAQSDYLTNALQAANPILTLLQGYTAKRGQGGPITGGAPGTRTDYLGAANSTAATVAQIIAAIRAGNTTSTNVGSGPAAYAPTSL